MKHERLINSPEGARWAAVQSPSLACSPVPGPPPRPHRPSAASRLPGGCPRESPFWWPPFIVAEPQASVGLGTQGEPLPWRVPSRAQHPTCPSRPKPVHPRASLAAGSPSPHPHRRGRGVEGTVLSFPVGLRRWWVGQGEARPAHQDKRVCVCARVHVRVHACVCV